MEKYNEKAINKTNDDVKNWVNNVFIKDESKKKSTQEANQHYLTLKKD